jgi:hypothetical protein
MSLTDVTDTDTLAMDVLIIVDDFLSRLPDIAMGDFVKVDAVTDFCLDLRIATQPKG